MKKAANVTKQFKAYVKLITFLSCSVAIGTQLESH